MEVTVIETDVFLALVSRLEKLSEQVMKYDRMMEQESFVWLGSDDVCSMLKISKPTLQGYRDRGVIPYSRISRKIYYRRDDIEHIIESRIITKSNRRGESY